MITNAVTAAANAPMVESVEMYAVARRVSRVPPAVMSAVDASGSARQIQAAAFIRPGSSSQGPQPVDVELEMATAHCNDEAEADDDLRRGDRHDGDREDLAVLAAVQARERDQRKVRAVQHDLDAQENDQGAAAEEHAERADDEQRRREDQVPSDARPVHRASSSLSVTRACAPSTTPPTAATSRTIDVI